MNYAHERLALGAELRRLRRDAGLTGVRLAEQTGISQSKISKIETGLLLPTFEDLNRIAAAVDAPHDRSGWLNEQLNFLQTEFNSWRIELRYGLAAKQFDVAELEQKSQLIRVFQMSVIPGLLQTPAYARSVMALANNTSHTDVEDAVRVRMQRQKLLSDSTRSFEFVITEPAIWSTFCARDVAAAQIQHLSGMFVLPNVRIAIAPMRTHFPTIPQNNFCLFDDRLATVETLTAEIQIGRASCRERV